MKAPDDFHALRRRVRLSGQLVTRTGLRIGAGQHGDADAVDLPVLRDADGYPFIPGASIKGVVRSTVESLVRGLGHPEREAAVHAWWACNPTVPKGGCGDLGRGDREAVDLTPHCVVCRLFGSHLLSSHVRFSDALALDRDEPPPIELRDGVGIDRDLRTVSGALKYDFQVVAPGTRFGLEVFVDNGEDWMLGLLAVAFDQLDHGFAALGGFTSRGLGRVNLGWSELLEVEPAGLLAGKTFEPVRGAEVESRFTTWRRALTQAVEEHV